jgi:hypothetical protein
MRRLTIANRHYQNASGGRMAIVQSRGQRRKVRSSRCKRVYYQRFSRSLQNNNNKSDGDDDVDDDGFMHTQRERAAVVGYYEK